MVTDPVSFPVQCSQCDGPLELICSMNDDEHVDETRLQTFVCPYCGSPNTLEVAGSIDKVHKREPKGGGKA